MEIVNDTIIIQKFLFFFFLMTWLNMESFLKRQSRSGERWMLERADERQKCRCRNKIGHQPVSIPSFQQGGGSCQLPLLLL